MNRVELKEELDRSGIDPDTYSVNDEYKEGCIALSQFSLAKILDFLKVRPIEKWNVSYCYQGNMVHRRFFNSESEACEYLLERLIHTLRTKQKYRWMNVNNLKYELDCAGVSPREYGLDGNNFPGDQMVLGEQSNGIWEVFYTERGYRSELVSFKSESAACEHFLDWVLSSKRWLNSEKK
jgi:hypothetical protein